MKWSEQKKRWWIGIVAICLLTTQAIYATHTEEEKGKRDRAQYTGNSARFNPDYFPGVVQLTFKSKAAESNCTGVAVNGCVITAAHCLTDFDSGFAKDGLTGRTTNLDFSTSQVFSENQKEWPEKDLAVLRLHGNMDSIGLWN